MQIPAARLPHAITVRPYQGTGPYGDQFGDTIQHRAYVEDQRRLVRSASGEEVVSETTVWTRLVEDFLVGSLVTVWAGTEHERTGRVITTTRYDRPSAWSHLEIALT